MTALTSPMSFPAPLASPSASPLTPAHLAQLRDAETRGKKIRRATVIATTDACISAFFTTITFLSALFSPSAILLAVPLGIITFNSFRGARRLRAFDPAAPKFLALNQLALAATLITYAAISLALAARGSSTFASAISNEPALAPMLANVQQLYWYISLAIYSALIVGTVLAQGLAALYYYTRRTHLAAYVAATPSWIVELQQQKVGG